MQNEIILFEDQDIKLEVNLKDETVWLNRNQMAKLFKRDVKTIGKHINKALKEELSDEYKTTIANFATVKEPKVGIANFATPTNTQSVVANFATTAKDGKIYQVELITKD